MPILNPSHAGGPVLEDRVKPSLTVPPRLWAGMRASREEQWLLDNRDAIAAYNRRIESDGPLLKPHWAN